MSALRCRMGVFLAGIALCWCQERSISCPSPWSSSGIGVTKDDDTPCVQQDFSDRSALLQGRIEVISQQIEAPTLTGDVGDKLFKVAVDVERGDALAGGVPLQYEGNARLPDVSSTPTSNRKNEESSLGRTMMVESNSTSAGPLDMPREHIRCRPLSEEPRPCSEQFVDKVRKYFTCPSEAQKAFLELPAGSHCGFGSTWPSRKILALESLVLSLFIIGRLLLWFFPASFKASPQLQRPPNVDHRLPAPPLLKDAEAVMETEPRILHQRFVRAVDNSPGAIALIDGDVTISYSELQAAALRVVWLLVESRGVTPCSRTPIGICAEGYELFQGILGIVQTGNPYVPLTLDLPEAQVNFICEDAQIKTVLVDSRALLPGSHWQECKEAVSISSAENMIAYPVNWNVSEKDLAYILYTSGSTGKPKGVMATHRSYHGRLTWMWKSFPFECGEVGIHKTVPIWVDHIQEVFGYLGGGIPVVIAPAAARKDPNMLTSLCREHGVSRIVLVPSLIRVLVAMHGTELANELPKLRCWITSGEPLSTELLKTFLSAAPVGTKLTNTYGSTEVAGDVTWVTFQADSPMPTGALAPIGKAMPGVRIHVLDPETLRPVEHGSPGELFVEGDFLAEGYLNRPEEEGIRFIKIPSKEFSCGLARVFRTGDFGKLDSASSIEFLGRKDQQVKVHGQRVEVLHVEHVLQNALCSCMRKDGKPKSQPPQAVIMAVPSKEDLGSYHLHAFIEGGMAAEKTIDLAEVKQQMLESLMPAHVPEAFWIEEALPRLPNSKLDRTTLLALAREKPQNDNSQEAPVIQEADSFGQIRYIAAQYADSRRALGNMMTYAIFKVVMGHWAEYWFVYGVVPNSSVWMRTLVAEAIMSEDAGFLMFALAVMHGMGGEERFKCSMTEPIMLGLGIFMAYLLPYVFHYSTVVATGASLYKCYHFFHGSAAYVYTPCNGPRISYFLLVAAMARIIIIVWHRLSSKLSTQRTALDLLLITCLTIGIQLSAPGVAVYIPTYIASFYFGPAIIQKISSISGPRPVLCFLGLLLYVIGCGSFVESGILPPFDDRCTHCVISVIAYFPVTVALFLFFVNLPTYLDFQMRGPIILFIYMTHYFFMNWVLHGVHFYGLRILPSYPDYVWLAGQLPDPFKSTVEPFAFIAPVVGYMLLVSFFFRMIAAGVAMAVRMRRSATLSV